jgi:hypothetical protein
MARSECNSEVNIKKWKGTVAEREEFKKAIARMMLYWVVFTRHDLREELLTGQPTGFLKRGVGGADASLKMTTIFTEREWQNFVKGVAALFNESVPDGSTISDVAKRINGHADKGWVTGVDCCPSNPILDSMLGAAWGVVDALWQIVDPQQTFQTVAGSTTRKAGRAKSQPARPPRRK